MTERSLWTVLVVILVALLGGCGFGYDSQGVQEAYEAHDAMIDEYAATFSAEVEAREGVADVEFGVGGGGISSSAQNVYTIVVMTDGMSAEQQADLLDELARSLWLDPDLRSFSSMGMSAEDLSTGAMTDLGEVLTGSPKILLSSRMEDAYGPRPVGLLDT